LVPLWLSLTSFTESGNPAKYWIPGQARNDKLHDTYIAMYESGFNQSINWQVGNSIEIGLLAVFFLFWQAKERGPRGQIFYDPLEHHGQGGNNKMLSYPRAASFA
jgi:hypothetical protein